MGTLNPPCTKIKTIIKIAIIFGLVTLEGCSLDHSTGYQGYVEGDFVYIGSSIGGRLTSLKVHKGEKVVSDEPLFNLDSEEESAVRRQARSQLKAAQSQLNDLKMGKRAPEIDVIKAQLDQAIAAEQKSAPQLKRDKILFQTNAISQTQLEESRAAEITNLAKIQELKKQLDVAKLPARQQLINAQTDQIDAAKAVLEQAIWKFDQKNISASQEGIIFDTLYRQGEWVPAGNPVIRMLPPSHIKIRFFVPETTLGQLKLGEPITIHCDGCHEDIPASITYIADEAEFTPPVIYSNETRSKLVYMIEAHPQLEKAILLHPGQPVEVIMP